MKDRKLAATAIAAAVLLVAMGITAAMVVRPAQASEIEPDWTWRIYPTDRTNVQAMQRIRLGEIGEWIDSIIADYEAEKAAAEQAALEAEQEAYYEPYYEPAYYDYAPSYSGIYYAEYSDAYNEDGPSHTMPGWHDGYLETYYNASSHYLASEWTLDSEGFYHDSNGRYVVGVDINDVNPETGQQYQYGDVVDTGKGEGVVYDYGQGAHVHDFATNW